MFPARVLGPERRKSDSREGERETKGRRRHKRERQRIRHVRTLGGGKGREEEQGGKGEETNRLKQRENEETGERTPRFGGEIGEIC